MSQACGRANFAPHSKHTIFHKALTLQTLKYHNLWHLSGLLRGQSSCCVCTSSSARHSSAVASVAKDLDTSSTDTSSPKNSPHNDHSLNASDQPLKLLETTATPTQQLQTSSATLGRDPMLLAAVTAILAIIAETTYMMLSAQQSLPPLQDVARGAAAAGALFLLLLPSGLLTAKALLGDKFHVEFHRGRLYITHGVPFHGPPLAPGFVRVGPTGDLRGNGAFAVVTIPAGTHLGDYSGDLLNRTAFRERYPDGVGNYAMAIDDEWVLDAVNLAPLTTSFHPVHMNHSRVRPNVGRYYCRAQRRVSFYTLVDVVAGQELLYDYGRSYWYGREHMELP